ncbi:hypothetical protein [uncultured Celeribacter sp.]|uniref:hypothetical protein n=1 Tax=uncultured Celeribacter sp. TaxID=1303376 RepID=UPI003747C805
MQTGNHKGAESSLRRGDIFQNLSVLLPALLVLVLGGVVQAQTYLNHDVAWVLNSSQRLLEGGTFGRDIVAANPPLIWWLSALVSGLSNSLGTDPVVTLRVVVLGMIGVGLAIAARGLAPVLAPGTRRLFLAFLALLLTVGVHRDFAQREHIAVVLCLPWLILMMHRAEGGGQDWRLAALAGICAGIGIAFKPHFLAVPALVWAYAALHRRSLRPVLTVETATIVLTGAAYLLAVWLFARPYLTEVVPLISQVYWGFDFPLGAVLLSRLGETVLAVLALALAARGGWRSAPTITALAALGFLIAAMAQSKGYSYHFYPVLAYALISLALSALSPEVSSARTRRLLMLPLGLGMVFAALQAAPALIYRSAQGTYGQQTACLVEMTQQVVPQGQGVMAFSTHPYPGFPVANYSHRRWVAETNSRLFLPAIARLRAQPELTPELTEVLALAEASERAAALRDLARSPKLVLVDARPLRHAIGDLPMDFIAFYQEDPAFAQIWAHYTEIPSCAPGIRAFELTKGF